MVLCASASKTSGEVLQSFYYKIRGRGIYTGENVITKDEINICGQAGFTTSPGRSNTGHVGNYDWMKAWMS